MKPTWKMSRLRTRVNTSRRACGAARQLIARLICSRPTIDFLSGTQAAFICLKPPRKLSNSVSSLARERKDDDTGGDRQKTEVTTRALTRTALEAFLQPGQKYPGSAGKHGANLASWLHLAHKDCSIQPLKRFYFREKSVTRVQLNV